MPLPVILSLIGLTLTLLVQTAVIAFWAGRTSQRLASVEAVQGGNSHVGEKVTRLTVEMEHANINLEKMGHQLEGVHRQLANIATNRMDLSGTL